MKKPHPIPFVFCRITACLTPAQGWRTHIHMHIELPTPVFKWQNPCKHGKALTENCRSRLQKMERGKLEQTSLQMASVPKIACCFFGTPHLAREQGGIKLPVSCFIVPCPGKPGTRECPQVPILRMEIKHYICNQEHVEL